MAYTVTFTRQGRKDILSLAKPTRMIILSWINENLNGSDSPTSVGDRRKLGGTRQGWRWRIGKHRILAKVDENTKTVEVFRVKTRQSAYDNLPAGL